MRFNFISVFLITFLIAGCATNSQRLAGPEDPFAMPIDEFMQETASLYINLKQGEPRELEAEEWEEFDEIRERITELVGNATEIEQIPMNRRRQLYELRSRMVQLVAGDIQSSRVCFTENTTGTRLRGNTRCYTLAELEQNRLEAQRLMDYIQRHPRGQHPDSEDPFNPLPR